MNSVENFIQHFHDCGKENLTDTFTKGCCYWFAKILCERFAGAKMMYDPVVNHYLAEINGRLYDITGDVTGEYTGLIPWDEFADRLERSRLIRDCVLFERIEE